MEDSSLSPRPSHFLLGSSTLDELYRPLPWLYLAFLVIWALSAFSWIVNTWRNRFVQVRRIIFFLEELSIAQSEFSIFKRNSVPFLELEIEVQAKMQKFSNRMKCYRREKELRLKFQGAMQLVAMAEVLEMNAADFDHLTSQQLHVGVVSETTSSYV
ncbi:hypothetical protein B296_00008664 [Ensete ventricosum]|uniref:Uncharacterized protein n=1 Tax=Ensete ventricosum TaxID=4639 RepID=A0A426ZXK7_ENSVE|nr:hypothetical protein B296_00008664 [Ensete ventricosum]